jgi:ferredoxin
MTSVGGDSVSSSHGDRHVRQSRNPITTLKVDPVNCDAFGYCAELLPELIALDEWGYPVISGEPVPAALASIAREVVRQCPRRALLIDKDP